MRAPLFPFLALIILPFGASAFSFASTSVSPNSLRNAQRGSSVAILVSSRGGEISKALGTGSRVSTPLKFKDHLASTTCSAGMPGSSLNLSLATARSAESRAAGAARCDQLCKRIVSMPRDDPALDLLTAAWVVEALQVAADGAQHGQPLRVTADAATSKRPPGLAVARAGAPVGAPAIENVGPRFFGIQETKLAGPDEQGPSTLRCPDEIPRATGLDAATGLAQSEYARGLQLWTRVAESFPPESDLANFALDWVNAYRSSSVFAGCEQQHWDRALFSFRWPDPARSQKSVRQHLVR